MNYVATWQVVCASDLRTTRFTAAQFRAFFEKPRAGGPMDCAIDPTTAQQCPIGRVNDCVDVECRDVPLNCLDRGHVRPALPAPFA